MGMAQENTETLPKAILRKHEKIPYSEIEPLLNLLKNQTGSGEVEILKAIGYANNSANDWRREQRAPLRAKYGLLGLAAEMKVEAAMVSRPKPVVTRQFDHQELVWIFGLLIGIDTPQHRLDHLSARVADEIVKAKQQN